LYKRERIITSQQSAEIEAHKTKEIAIRTYELPRFFEWETYYLKFEHIYLGHNKNGKYFLPLKDLTSSITVGESGAGKSNFLNMIIFSLLHNFDYIEHLHFIDLKGVELSRYKLKNTTFTDNIEETEILLENLKNEMNLRFKEMKEKQDLIYDGKYKICLIDEIGTISTHHNKKAKENIFNSLIEIAQKGRASKVILLIFSQKIDSTNIPTNVLTNLQSSYLLKSSSQFNINNTIGLQEEIEEITRTRVQDFPKGRLIFKDGLTSEKILIQTPYLSKEIQEIMIKYFQSRFNK
jgi:S-DNA-T family DNA segregation ATPase FtsK/SpoIIIE